jgi:hypothetical protein
MHVAAVAEQVSRAPQELDPGALLFFLQNLRDCVEVLVAFGQGLAFGRNVTVVEAVEGGAQLLDELERNTRAILGIFDGVLRAFPRPLHGPRAERITSGAAERMPVGNAEAEVILHRFAFHLFVFVIVVESEQIF